MQPHVLEGQFCYFCSPVCSCCQTQASAVSIALRCSACGREQRDGCLHPLWGTLCQGHCVADAHHAQAGLVTFLALLITLISLQAMGFLNISALLAPPYIING